MAVPGLSPLGGGQRTCAVESIQYNAGGAGMQPEDEEEQ
jgi:hypothetical protein